MTVPTGYAPKALWPARRLGLAAPAHPGTPWRGRLGRGGRSACGHSSLRMLALSVRHESGLVSMIPRRRSFASLSHTSAASSNCFFSCGVVISAAIRRHLAACCSYSKVFCMAAPQRTKALLEVILVFQPIPYPAVNDLPLVANRTEIEKV
jgi:hypothetical protein